ncbi:hypothetical protein JOM56_001847 [Amanita muscaria]
MPAQASTTLQQHESVGHSPGAGDEGKPGISVPSQAPPSTPELPRLEERDARSWETQGWKARDSKPGIVIASPTVDHSLKTHRDYYNKYPVYGGQVYTPPPAYSSTYPPIPGGIPLTASSKWPKLNSLLGAGGETLVRFDVRKRPREAILMNAYHLYGLQPAIISGSPVTYLRFYSKSIPWCIDIKTNGHPVMCRDVWNAIYEALQQEIDDSEWGMVVRDEKLRETVENAAKTRRRGDKKESNEIKRIDFLGEETIFKGLEKDDDLAKVRLLPGTQGCEETWIAVFSA